MVRVFYFALLLLVFSPPDGHAESQTKINMEITTVLLSSKQFEELKNWGERIQAIQVASAVVATKVCQDKPEDGSSELSKKAMLTTGDKFHEAVLTAIGILTVVAEGPDSPICKFTRDAWK